MKPHARNALRVGKRTTLLMIVIAITVAVRAQTDQAAKKADSVRGVKYQPLNVKPGLWENTLTITHSGELPIPAEMLSRLTPEQRARMEQRMKANAAAQSHTVTDKHCTKPEDLQNPNYLNPNPEYQCVVTVLESTRTRASGKMSCHTQDVRFDGALEVNAPDPEHMNSTYHATAAGNGHTMNIDAKSSSKWLGSSCENAQ